EVGASPATRIGAACQPADDASRARFFVLRAGRPAHEDAATADRVAWTFRVVRPCDLNAVDRGFRVSIPREFETGHGKVGAEKPFFLDRFLDERDADEMLACCDRQPYFEAAVSVELVFSGVRHRLSARPNRAWSLAPDCELLHAFTVQTHLELVRLGNAAYFVAPRPLQPDFDDVLAVERKVMPDRHAAPRPERELFVHPSVLHQVFGGGIRL